MGLLLKQSTAADLLVGPFVDEDDGKTAETGLTVTQAEVRLSKNGGNMAQKNEATALSHDELGYYVCKLDATDTNTLGRLQLCIHESGALPVYHEFMVVTANHYDSQCSTDYKQVDIIQVAGGAEDIATETKQDVIDGNVDAILVDTAALDGRLTDARAGYLDELAAANLPTDIAAVSAAIAALNDFDPAADTVALVTDITTKTGFSLSATGIDSVWDEVMDATAPANADTARKIINILVAVLGGKSSGGGTATNVFRNTGDTKNRVSATVDADGNRTAVGTLDGT